MGNKEEILDKISWFMSGHKRQQILSCMDEYAKPFINSLNDANDQNSQLILDKLELENTISKQQDLLNHCYEKLTLCRPHVAGLGPIVYKIKNYK